MDFIRFCINNPVKVTVGVLLVILMGLIALFAIPVQLTPNVDQPVITVTTDWTGRSPEEVEREIIEKQEDKLKGISNVKKMTAAAHQGRAEVRLQFYIGTDMGRALQETSDKLREVPDYPDGADQPVIVAADSAVENPISWIVLTSDDPSVDVASIYDDLDKRVKPIIERISGVSEMRIYGGRSREVHIRVDPKRMAERGITFNALRSALQLENVNVSAGDLPDGMRDIRIRTVGQYEHLESIRQTIVTYTAAGPVRVKDLASVELTLEKERAFVRSNGQPSLAMGVIRETGANVVQIMDQVKVRVAELNQDGSELKLINDKLKMTIVYDETIYIRDALSLVLDNLWQGGLLAVLVLLFFLHKIRPTFIIGLAIPISVIGTFTVMWLLGRNINVVSLAGLAFAVGMVVDNAIVVLENTDRHIAMGKSAMKAAYDATSEVWLAMLASTGTTLIVFIPVIFMKEEAGQLFKDISLAICVSIGLSLIVAVTVIPAASAKMLKPHGHRKHAWAEKADGLFGLASVIGTLNTRFAQLVQWICEHPVGGAKNILRLLIGTAIVLLSLAGLLLPAVHLADFKQSLFPMWMGLFGLALAAISLFGLVLLLAPMAWAKRLRGDVHWLGVTFLAVACGLTTLLGLGMAGFTGFKLHMMATFMKTPGPMAQVAGLFTSHGLILLIGLGMLLGILMMPLRFALIGTFTLGSFAGAWLMLPPMSYLPSGNQNFVFGIMLTPPAYTLDHNRTIGQRMEARMDPFLKAKSYDETKPISDQVIHPFAQMPVSIIAGAPIPPVENFFFVSFPGTVFFGAASTDRQNVVPIEGLLMWAGSSIPDSISLAFQASIFGRGLGGSNSIDVEIVGDNMTQLRQSADALKMSFWKKYGPQAVQPDPLNFDKPGPELQLQIDRVRAADLGVNVSDMGQGVQALIDGLKVGDYRYQGDAIDMLLTRAPGYELTPDRLDQVPMATHGADGQLRIVPLSSVARFVHTVSPQQINRIEQRRAITLKVMPPETVPLETVTTEIQQTVSEMKQKGTIPPAIQVKTAGTADDLAQVRQALLGQWYGWNMQSLQSFLTSRLFLATLINYFLMCALFESWLYPFVILFSVPLATIGGFLGLRLVHEFVPTQQLDVLTMLGFVVLLGTVVNNAILLVAQALNYMQGFGESEQDIIEKMPPLVAIRESVRTRMRPVMMTTLTTLFGLVPLVVKPGSGSEIYRGLGSVVLGGLLVSTIFTLLVVPVMFSLMVQAKQSLYRRLGWEMKELKI